MKTKENDPELAICVGYLRKPHHAPIVLEFQHPDGHKTGLCRVCANRWALSDEEFPPTSKTKSPTFEGKSPTQMTSQTAS